MSTIHDPVPPIERHDLNLGRPLIRWATVRLAAYCPGWLAPETICLSGLGFAAMTAGALALSNVSRAWLWLAVLGLALRSLADCLDGEVARRRRLTSDHGMFLDIFIDDLSFAVIFAGFALCRQVNSTVAMASGLVYILNDMLATLRMLVLRQHVIPIIGPIEVAILMALACVVGFFVPGPLVRLAGHSYGAMDITGLLGIAYGATEFLISGRQIYSELKRAGR